MKYAFLVPLVLAHALQALSPAHEIKIRTMIRDIEAGNIRGACIWHEIADMSIDPEDDEHMLVKELDMVAVVSLYNDMYDVLPNARITQDIRNGNKRPKAPGKPGDILISFPVLVESPQGV